MIYFIEAPTCRLIKIGVSKDPFERGRLMQVISPATLRIKATMAGGKPEEQAIHARFSTLRHHGEWFRVAPELLDFIAAEATIWTGIQICDWRPKVPVSKLNARLLS